MLPELSWTDASWVGEGEDATASWLHPYQAAVKSLSAPLQPRKKLSGLEDYGTANYDSLPKKCTSSAWLAGLRLSNGLCVCRANTQSTTRPCWTSGARGVVPLVPRAEILVCVELDVICVVLYGEDKHLRQRRRRRRGIGNATCWRSTPVIRGVTDVAFL